MSNEIRALGEDSTRPILQEVYMSCSANQVAVPQRSSIRGVSVGSQFRSSLQNLVTDLERTHPHYIRCIKPNEKKAAGGFNVGRILTQLRYSGMMEAIRIRREGYAFREEHEKFYNRFSVLLTPEDLNHDGKTTGIDQLVRALSRRLNVTDSDWQVGHSKIFLRRELADKLERLAKLRVQSAARTVGRFGRRMCHQRLSQLLVSWIRFRLHMLSTYRRRRAATKLSSKYRCYQARASFVEQRSATIKVQSIQRRIQAKQYVRLMRDPFCDTSYQECRAMLRKGKTRLEEAVAKKDFRTASKLEAEM